MDGNFLQTSGAKGVARAKRLTIEVAPGVHVPYTLMTDASGGEITVQNPFPCDGDSVYAKDLDISRCSADGFIGEVAGLFNDYNTDLVNPTSTSPKTIVLYFERPIKTNIIGLGSYLSDFSNVKLSLLDLSGTVREVIDDSANDTKYTSNVYSFTTAVFIQIVIEFYTADAVSINGMYIPKIQSRAISSIDGLISMLNSTETPLAGDAVFTGGSIDTLNYGMILLSVYADVASATNGLLIQFRSTLTSTWRTADTYTIAAGTEKTFSLQPVRRFMRVIYTNGAVAQSVFDLQVALKPVYVKPSSHRISDIISGEDDAELSKSIVTGQSELTNAFENVSTFRGALSVSEGLRHRTMVNKQFHLPGVISTTLAVQAEVNDTSIQVVDATGIAPNAWIEVYTDDPAGEMIFQVTGTPGGNVLVLDRPIPVILHVGHVVETVGINLAVDGTLAAPKIFYVAPPAGVVWQVTRMILSITDATAMDDGTFGGMAALTNGVVVRGLNNGAYRNGACWKTNADIANSMYDYAYVPKPPAGTGYGDRGRWTFTASEIVQELVGDTGDQLQILVQDSLSSLVTFTVLAQGRIYGG